MRYQADKKVHFFLQEELSHEITVISHDDVAFFFLIPHSTIFIQERRHHHQLSRNYNPHSVVDDSEMTEKTVIVRSLK